MPTTNDTLYLRVTATNLGIDDLNNVAFQIEFEGLTFVAVDAISAGTYDSTAHLWTLPNVFEYEPTDDNYEYLVLQFTVTADPTEPNITFKATEVSSLVPVAEYETVIDEALPVTQEELAEILFGVDATRVSKLVSPNGIHDPVVQATNGGDVYTTTGRFLVGYTAPIFGETLGVDGDTVVFQDTGAAINSKWRLLGNRDSDGYNYLQVGTDSLDVNARLRITRFGSTLPLNQFRVGADLSHLEGNVRLGASNQSNIDIGESRPSGATNSGIYFQSDGDQRAAMSMVSDTWGYSTAFVTGGYVDNKGLSGTPLSIGSYFRSLGNYSPWVGRPIGMEFVSNGAVWRVSIGDAVPTGADQSITFQEKFRVSWPEVVVNEGGDTDFRVRSTTNTHAFFVDAGNTYVGVGGSVLDHLFHVKTATASQGAHIGNAYIGNWSNNVYAQFSHWSYRGNSTAYALLQSSAADTYLNAGAGRTLHLRINNTSVAQITATGMTLVMPTHNIQFIDAVNTGGTTGNGYITCLVNGATRYIWLNPLP